MITEVTSVCPAQFLRKDSQVSVCRQTRQQARHAGSQIWASASEPEGDHSAPAERIPLSDLGSIGLNGKREESVLMFDGTLSPADLSYLDNILVTFGLDGSIVAGMEAAQDSFPEALGTPPSGEDDGKPSDRANKLQMAAAVAGHMGWNCHRLPMPIGVARTDELLRTLQKLSDSPRTSRRWTDRDRLVERLTSRNGRLANRRVVVYGEEIDFVVGVVSLVLEAGLKPMLCASTSCSKQLRQALEESTPELHTRTAVIQAERFADLEPEILAARPDVMIANRDARTFAGRTRIPFVCAGRPLCNHNENGLTLQIGYRGALQLLDRMEAALSGRSELAG